MEINIVSLKKVVNRVETLSRNVQILRHLYNTFGDEKSRIDPYLHAYSQALEDLNSFILMNELFKFDEGEFEEYNNSPNFKTAILDMFAGSYGIKGDITSSEEYVTWNEKLFHFIKLITAFMYYRHRHIKYAFENGEDERNCYYFWLEIRKFNRDNNLIRGVSDEELLATLMAWYNESIVPKDPNLFENIDCIKNGEIVKTYVGPRPIVPASEMVEGYDFDVGI
jgi:hypothetical protein